MPDPSIVQYGLGGAVIGLAYVVFYIVRRFLESIDRITDRHDASYKALSENIQENTLLTRENLAYLQKRNGTLDHALGALETAQTANTSALTAQTSQLKENKKVMDKIERNQRKSPVEKRR